MAKSSGKKVIAKVLKEKKEGAATFRANAGGWSLDPSATAGKELTDDQARTLVLERLTDVLDGMAANIGKLAEALEKSRFS